MGQTVKDFIKNNLVDEFKTIQQTESHHYLSFGLISLGIEFIGACLDEKNGFFTEGKSDERFRKAVSDLFPASYQNYNIKKDKFDLYKNLRCGLLHIFVPGPNIELIQESERVLFGNCNHLEIKKIRGNDRLILVSQEFFKDYENACNSIISKIENKELKHEKVYKEILGFEP